MTVHKLILDDVFEEVECTLIGIHCNIEDYRLAYLLNKHLGISLSRKSLDLDFNERKGAFSIFDWEDTKQLETWSLVSNVFKTEVYQSGNQSSLFETQQSIIKTTHLIPEQKAVNYFLKINNAFNLNKEKQILNNIINIPLVATAFSIDINQLKSKDNLIFS